MGEVIKGDFSVSRHKDREVSLKTADIIDLNSKRTVVEGEDREVISLSFIGNEGEFSFNTKSFKKIVYNEYAHAILVWFNEPIEADGKVNPWDLTILLEPNVDGNVAFETLMSEIRRINMNVSEEDN